MWIRTLGVKHGEVVEVNIMKDTDNIDSRSFENWCEVITES